jgi:hypothetical protein
MANGAGLAAAGAAAANAQQVIDATADQLILDAAAALTPPPRTLDTLVAEAMIAPHTIAHQILQEAYSVPWEETMAPFTCFLSVTKANPYQANVGQWLYVDDMSKNYYLAVIENKWEVFYSYRRCTPLHANGHRLNGLRGDRLLMKGNITVLEMYQLQGEMNNQSELFSLNTAQALTTARSPPLPLQTRPQIGWTPILAQTSMVGLSSPSTQRLQYCSFKVGVSWRVSNWELNSCPCSRWHLSMSWHCRKTSCVWALLALQLAPTLQFSTKYGHASTCSAPQR